MHSNGMRTARLLAVSRRIPSISRGVCPPPPDEGPLDADPLLMWHVMHDRNPTPPPTPREKNDT